MKSFLLTICCFLLLILCSWERKTYAQPESNLEVPATEQKVEPEQDVGLPLFEEMELPDVPQLLQGPRQDWILLIGGRVLVTPAIQPRPDHLEWLLAEQKKLLASRPNDQTRFAEWLTRYKRYNFVYLSVTDEGIEDDYRLHTRYIDRIYYHEDLALLKVDQLLKSGQIETALRLITSVARSEFENNRRRREKGLKSIEWPGLLDRRRSLLTAEVTAAEVDNNLDRAFGLVLRHWEFDPQFNQLPEHAGRILNKLAEKSLSARDYRRIRFDIKQVKRLFPQHTMVSIWEKRLDSLATAQMQAAQTALQQQNEREASVRGRESLEIWPFNRQLQRQYQQIQERYQILRVGFVEDDEHAQHYRDQLLHHHWFEIDRLIGGYPHYQTRFIESWFPEDLGRQIRLTMKLRKQPRMSQPVTSSHDFADELLADAVNRPVEERGLYGGCIASINLISPKELEIRLQTQSPHPFAQLSAVMNSAPDFTASALKNSFYSEGKVLSLDQARKPARCYLRSSPPPQAVNQRGIAEIEEYLYPDENMLVRGLLRDEIDFLPDVPSKFVNRLNQDQRFFVQQYQVPLSTNLRFYPNGSLSSFPEWRLALLMAIDRERLLNHLHPTDSSGRDLYRITNSISPSSSHVWNETSAAASYDPTAARALAVLLSKSTSFSRSVRLKVSQEKEAQLTAKTIAAQWNELGVETQLIDAASEAPCDAELSILAIEAPHIEIPQLLTSSGLIPLEQLKSLPLALRQPLLNLEQARNWGQVDQHLQQLQQQLLIDAWVLPLWEQERFLVARREIRNIPATPVRSFQAVDEWILEAITPGF